MSFLSCKRSSDFDEAKRASVGLIRDPPSQLSRLRRTMSFEDYSAPLQMHERILLHLTFSSEIIASYV